MPLEVNHTCCKARGSGHLPRTLAGRPMLLKCLLSKKDTEHQDWTSKSSGPCRPWTAAMTRDSFPGKITPEALAPL